MMQVFPENVLRSFSIQAKESFNTLVSGYEGQNQQRLMTARFPLRMVTIPYNKVVDSEWPTLHNFFRKRFGGFDPFWFFATKQRNYIDEFVGRGGPFEVDGAIADDGGVQTDETDKANDATANDMILLPAAPAIDDCYYWLKDFMCDKLTLTIGIPGVGTWTIVWEYLKTTGVWGAFSGVTDGTTGFKAAAGDHDVTWTMPSDWADTTIKRRWGYPIRARVSAFTSITTQPKGTKATLNTKTYDLPSKSTVNDASLIAYVNDVVTAKTFISGGGGGGADRIAFAGYQAVGSLITADLAGLLRLRAVLGDDFNDEWFNQRFSKMQFTLTEVP